MCSRLTTSGESAILRSYVPLLARHFFHFAPVPSQTFDAMLRNRAYIAQIDVPEFGISSQSSLAQKQRLHQVFFPDGIRFDGKRLVGTGVTLPVFNYLSPISDEKKELVDQNSASWNPLLGWLYQIDGLRRDAEAVEAQAEAS